jgi:hypothetical protein
LKAKAKSRISKSKFENIFIPESLAGLARAHKIIRIEREKELQFMKICSQIRLDNFKEDRADSQREERRLKRGKNY